MEEIFTSKRRVISQIRFQLSFSTFFSMALRLINYSTNAIVVTGDTKNYKDYLKQIPNPTYPGTFVKASWNANLTDPTTGQKMGGWVFPKAQAAAVGQVVAQINDGEVVPIPSPPRRYGAQPAAQAAAQPAVATLPVTTVPGRTAPVRMPTTLQSQTLTYTVPNPMVGMKGSINWDGQSIPIIVTSIDNPKTGAHDMGIVQHIPENEEAGDSYRLAIVAGEWQVIGMTDDHTVTFTV
jgi:hypothetical protein